MRLPKLVDKLIKAIGVNYHLILITIISFLISKTDAFSQDLSYLRLKLLGLELKYMDWQNLFCTSRSDKFLAENENYVVKTAPHMTVSKNGTVALKNLTNQMSDWPCWVVSLFDLGNRPN